MVEQSSWSNYAIYLPLWIALARWSAFIFLRVIPSLFYKQIKQIDISNCEKINDEENNKILYKLSNGQLIEMVNKEDLTAVVTVYQPPEGFMKAMTSLKFNNPKEVLIIADITCAAEVKEMLSNADFNMDKFIVIPEEQPGKRAALVTGIKHTKTKLVALVDDDAVWCDTFLENLILPFQYPHIGGVGVKQVAAMKSKWNITDVLADMRLSVRYLELRSTTTIDKGCSCISGRTGCYRTNLLQNEDFYKEFLNEKFFGMQTLSGDDKFLTRWVSNHGFDTYHQLNNSCKLETTFETAHKLCFQLARWSRNTTRSDFKNLFIERKIWKNHPFTAIVMLDKFITPFILMYGPIFVVIFLIIHGFDYVGLIGFICWIIFSRALRLCYHLYEKPHHIIYIPFFIFFQYFQALVRIYAMFTVYNRNWGTRSVSVIGNQVQRTGPVITTKNDNDSEHSHISTPRARVLLELNQNQMLQNNIIYNQSPLSSNASSVKNETINVQKTIKKFNNNN